MKLRRTQVVALVAAAIVVIAGKEYYRTASAADLRWILAPTAHVASWLGFGHFTFDAQLGYLDRDLGFAIAPPCAGLHFALAAFVALTIGWLGAMTNWRAMATHLAAAAALAYLATFIINTVRILIAIRMHRMDLADREEMHRLEGIVVYLGGLCALYALARRHHAVARS